MLVKIFPSMPFPCPLKSPLLLLRGPSPSPLRNTKSTVYVAHIHQSHAHSPTVLANRLQIPFWLFKLFPVKQSRRSVFQYLTNLHPAITTYYSLAALWRIGGFFLRKIWAANSIVLLQVTLIILEKMEKDAPFQIEWWASPLFITSHHFLHDWNLYRNTNDAYS